jgi:hypothetical protein
MTILADYSFIHLITPAKPPASMSVIPTADEDLFIYIMTEHYNSK